MVSARVGYKPHYAASCTAIAVIVSALALRYAVLGKKEEKNASTTENDYNDIKQQEDLGSVVAYSSCLIAASRAVESERPDALVVDPLACILAFSALQEKRQRTKEDNDSTWRIAIRTRYFDDYVCSFLEKNRWAAQVVNLGTGMDSRAYRLDAPDGAIFYEVDNANVLRLKEKLLDNASKGPNTSEQVRKMIEGGMKRRRVVVANVENVAQLKRELLKAGFNPERPTCWVLEGLTYYLKDETVVSDLFSVMHELSTSGSCLIVSVASESSIERAKKSTNELMKSWRWGVDQPDRSFSLKRWGGWDCGPQDVVTLGDDRANYGRFRPSDSSTRGLGGKRSGIMYVTAKY